MARSVWDYRWSSARAHIKGQDLQGVIDTQQLLELSHLESGCMPAILYLLKIID